MEFVIGAIILGIGVILATGNHLPANIPAPMLEQYRAYVQANRNR